MKLLTHTLRSAVLTAALSLPTRSRRAPSAPVGTI